MGKRTNKGYNIYQLRMYSVRDELFSKENYIDHESAKRKLLQYLEDEHNGPACSRGIIRKLDPIRKSWVVPTGINNPHALLLNPEEAVVEEWKLTLYDMGDRIIESARFSTAVTDKQAELVMLNKNAFYGVVSAREPGQQNFIISRIQLNEQFHVRVLNPTPAKHQDPHIPKSGENLALIYAKALAEDRAETERLKEAMRLQGDG